MSKNDGFLDRWSRKKLENEPVVEEVAVAPEETLEGLSDEEILERLELPDPESLSEGDDFQGFMNAAVPDHLRRKALRVLWRSNPALANLDGLLEYGEDYTDAAMVPEVLNTAYKVGKGFLKDILDEEDEETTQELVAEEQPLTEEPEAEEIAPEEIIEVAQIEQPLPEPRHARPRMQFRTS